MQVFVHKVESVCIVKLIGKLKLYHGNCIIEIVLELEKYDREAIEM